jgi:hypothetical protein
MFKSKLEYLYSTLLLAFLVVAVKVVYTVGFASTGVRRRAQKRI